MVSHAGTAGMGKFQIRTSSWAVASLALTLVFLLPILSVFIAASGDTGDLWPHLFRTVLPRYIANTLMLM